jgi:hypothetical protein
MKKLILIILGFMLAATLFAAEAATLVPAGNRNAEQPDIPGASSRRTQATNTTFQAKYRKVYALLQKDSELRGKITKAAAAYRIDPMHIVGAIVGEHTYNVDAYDRLQTYYVKAISYLSSKLSFAYDGEDITDFVQRPEFGKCTGISDSYDLWECREQVWNRSFPRPYGRRRELSQRSLRRHVLSALLRRTDVRARPAQSIDRIADERSRASGFRPAQARRLRSQLGLQDHHGSGPDAALCRRDDQEIDRCLQTIAGFDISGNPGLTATLYNVGNPEQRAYALKAENDKRRAAGEQVKLPEENYYGWLVNDKLDELRALF